jgi:hypothetical protein
VAVADEEEPLWRRIVTNELVWLVVGAGGILALAFHLATR